MIKVYLNGRRVGTEALGCAWCGSTWNSSAYLSLTGSFRCNICGRVWRGFYARVDGGSRLFFCCGDHYREFLRLVRDIKEKTGLEDIEELHIITPTREVYVKGKGKFIRVYLAPLLNLGENEELRYRILVEPLN